MNRKNNFLLYTENIEEIEELSMEQRGLLLTALLYYQDGRDVPEMDALTRMVFKFLKKRIDYDNESYEKKCLQNKANGSKGGRPKNTDNTKNKENQTDTEKTERFLEKPKKPDIDTDIDTDNSIISFVDCNIKSSNKKQLKQEVINNYYEDKELNDLFLEYLDIRKKIKAVNSERAIKNLISTIQKLSNGNRETAKALINQSITNSWKDIYPLKKNGKGSSYIDAIDNRVSKVDTFGTDHGNYSEVASPWEKSLNQNSVF